MARSARNAKTAKMAVTMIERRTVMIIAKRIVATKGVRVVADTATESEAVYRKVVMSVMTEPASVRRLVATAISSLCVEERGTIKENNHFNIRNI